MRLLRRSALRRCDSGLWRNRPRGRQCPGCDKQPGCDISRQFRRLRARTMKLAPCLFLLGLAVGTCAAESRIEAVDDPVQLAALGFAPDATDVWRRYNDADPYPRRLRANDGIIAPSHAYSIIGGDFQMTSSASDYSTGGNGALSCPTGQSVRIASATVRVPDGKRLAYIDMW